MNKENIQKWVDALRSGKYEKCQWRLRRGDRYCALGVVCDVSGLGEWADGLYCVPHEGPVRSVLPDIVQILLGVHGNYPYFVPLSGGNDISDLNDDPEYSFDMIADIIEKEFLRE
jgi:hypothetical protein